MAIVSEQEKNRLERTYPLFKWDFVAGAVHFGNGHSFHPVWTESGQLDLFSEVTIRTTHADHSTAERLMECYPCLYISVHQDRNGSSVTVWVKRNNRDAEAISGTMLLDSSNLHYWLYQANKEASWAVQDGWFFCTGHNKAEKKEPGYFFLFAGSYCKQYGEERPDVLNAARKETYN